MKPYLWILGWGALAPAQSGGQELATSMLVLEMYVVMVAGVLQGTGRLKSRQVRASVVNLVLLPCSGSCRDAYAVSWQRPMYAALPCTSRWTGYERWQNP